MMKITVQVITKVRTKGEICKEKIKKVLKVKTLKILNNNIKLDLDKCNYLWKYKKNINR